MRKVGHKCMFHSVALAFKNEQVAVVSQPVNYRGGHLVVGEDGASLRLGKARHEFGNGIELYRHTELVRAVRR